MKTTNETDALNELILTVEKRRDYELHQLKEQFHIAYESIKPINLIKNAFHDMTSSPEVKKDLLSNAIGLGTGYLSKKLLTGNTHNPIKKAVGGIIQFAVANLVSSHTDDIKSIGGNLLKRFMKPKKNKKEE